MTAINLSDYYAFGYYLRWAEQREHLKNELTPGKRLSLSSCICPTFGWGNISETHSLEEAQRAFSPYANWGAYWDFRNQLPDPEAYTYWIFESTDAARQFIDDVLLDTTDLYLIGVGLPKTHAHRRWYMAENATEKTLEYWADQQLPLEPGGTPLGFDVVSTRVLPEGSLFSHSWLCSLSEVGVNGEFGIRANEFGLLAETDAIKLYEWIAEDDMQGRRSEPEPYEYWLLVSYLFEGK